MQNEMLVLDVLGMTVVSQFAGRIYYLLLLGFVGYLEMFDNNGMYHTISF